MSIKAKIKGLLTMNAYNEADLAATLGISVQALRNKISRGSFSAADLVKFAAFVGGTVTLSSDHGSVTLEPDDLT